MNKLLKALMWILFFPFMLTYWGFKTKKKSVMAIGTILIVLFLAIGIENQKTDDGFDTEPSKDIEQSDILGNLTETIETEEQNETSQGGNEGQLTAESIEVTEEQADEIIEDDAVIVQPVTHEDYTLIEVDGGDLSGHREANVVVDIGYGEREYYAYTNEFGQLVRVEAAEIILQDDTIEPVNAAGRYYPDEAKVPGTEAADLDEGHVIADSLGGVSNAYNITPQDSTLNRHGNQAYMEKVIRDAGGCEDFLAIITYPDKVTQIPSHYSFTYTIQGNKIHDEFDNVDPDKVNAVLNVNDSKDEVIVNEPSVVVEDGVAKIQELDKKAEYIVIQNTGATELDMSGWVIVSVKGNQRFTFPEFELNAGGTVKVGDSDKNPDVNFHWLDGRGTWNNSESDPAELYNKAGELVDRFND